MTELRTRVAVDVASRLLRSHLDSVLSSLVVEDRSKGRRMIVYIPRRRALPRTAPADALNSHRCFHSTMYA